MGKIHQFDELEGCDTLRIYDSKNILFELRALRNIDL
jgi:hypothetical protein